MHIFGEKTSLIYAIMASRENDTGDAFIRGINRQNIQHWKVMYRHYYAALCSYVSRMLDDMSDEVEDLVQDVFLAIWNSKRQFASQDELVNYLYRACYNNTLIYIRNNRIHHTILSNMEQPEAWDDSDELYALALQEELIRQLHFYVDQLPESQSRIIRLRLKGHTWNEIADNHARELEHCEDTEAAELQVSERASVENLLRAVLHADGWWRQNIKL